MPERYAKITGWGKYVPERVITNADLEKMVETSDEWITSRTGIKERHIRADGEQSSDLSVKSALKALEVAGLKPTDLDLIIVACSSPDYLVPGVATIVQDKLGAKCGAFQISSGCSGWVYALVVGTQFITSGAMNNILVVGTDVVSFGTDYTDRGTCVLFGDASASVILQTSDQPAGVMTFELGSDGAGIEHLYVPAGGSALPMHGNHAKIEAEHLSFLKMNGTEVFKFATRTLAASMKRVIDQAGLLPDDVQLFIPHQANYRIIESAARMMRQPLEKFMINIHKYGNTSAASVPLAFVEAIEEGRCKPGDKISMCAFGAGLTWASAVVQFGVGEFTPAHTLFSIGRARYLAKRTAGRLQDTLQQFLLNMQIRRMDAKKKR
ncbi:MAG TPA: beta-ketoacyl-ACP synthase III [Aggregatilineales bacterium]|nr:ketoacyl-ACP synthase III [Anaerolineales bacterium]HRE47965.1 beta-ketoacyl-ACP synthase III [Aggregatilineales bacterium]